MQDEPTPEELIKAVADFLRDEIAPGISGHHAFKLRVSLNALDLVTRQLALEKAGDAALSGEVLPPEVREHAPQTAGAQAIALAYGDYTRKSVLAGRFLVERLVTVRSFEEAIEIQGEFAKQAFANFVAHSERICELYGAWAQQYFRPFDKFAAQWNRIGH